MYKAVELVDLYLQGLQGSQRTEHNVEHVCEERQDKGVQEHCSLTACNPERSAEV